MKYLEPPDRRNRAAMGYNMYGEWNRRIAMDRAGDTGIPALSAPVILKQEIDELKQPGFILFVPVYNNGGIPSTLNNRRNNLSGYVFSPFRSHDLFRAIIKELPPTAINLRVLDATSTKSILLFSSNDKSQMENDKIPRFSEVQTAQIRGRTWRLEYASPPNWGSSYLKGALPATAITGTIFSLLILIFGLALVRARQNAEAAIMQLRSSEKQLQDAGAALEWKVAERTNSLERTISDQALMKEFTDQLQACFSIEEASGAIKHFSAKLFPNWSGCVSLIKASKNHMEVISHWGAEDSGQSLFAPDECWALRRGRPHHVEDGKSGLACPHFGNLPANEFLCVPMIAQGDTVGIFHLYRKSGEGRLVGEKHLAINVAEHVGLVLANIKLRDVLRAQSVRDPLTNLFNRRYMEASMERELARCVRNGQPLSVIMMDLDNFKSFNDTYGHEVGDEILRGLGRILANSVRGEDIACRYGGEEFLTILPDASFQDAIERAESIRLKVAEAIIPHRNKEYNNLTISIGVAAFPEHGDDAAALVRKADLALYQAKAGGRNRVNGYTEEIA